MGKKVLAFGEILWDVIDGKRHPGGAPFNFAAHYRQCGGISAILSKVGDDADGEAIAAQADNMGVITELLQKDFHQPTGSVTVSLSHGQPSYNIHQPVAYDFIEAPNAEQLAKYDTFYFGTLAQRNKQSRAALYQVLKAGDFKEVFYDVNLREGQYDKETIDQSLKHCTILKLNDEEVITLSEMLFGSSLQYEEFMEAAFKKYSQIHMIILTKGAKGCAVHQRDESYINIPAKRVTVVDTVGAGDSFSASFLYAYLHDASPKEAAHLATMVAGHVASKAGAVPTYTEEINSLIKGLGFR